LIQELRLAGAHVRESANRLSEHSNVPRGNSRNPQIFNTSHNRHSHGKGFQAACYEEDARARAYDVVAEIWEIIGADLADAADLDIVDAQKFIVQKMEKLRDLTIELRPNLARSVWSGVPRA